MADGEGLAVPLLRAWAAWDKACDLRSQHPEDENNWQRREAQRASPSEDTTRALEDAVVAFAAAAGWTPTQLREHMAAIRRLLGRQGMDRRLANRWALATALGHT